MTNHKRKMLNFIMEFAPLKKRPKVDLDEMDDWLLVQLNLALYWVKTLAEDIVAGEYNKK